jgi:hypothetical protein
MRLLRDGDGRRRVTMRPHRGRKRNQIMSTGTSQLSIPNITQSIFKDATAMVRPWVKLGLDGFPGSGKSHTAILIAIGIYKAWKHEGPVYIFDNEKAAKFLQPMMAKEKIQTRVVEGDQLDVLKAAIAEVESAGGLLLIDSLTKVYDRTVRDYLGTSKTVRKTLEIQDRPIVNEAWRTNFEDVFINAECHIIFTGRATIEWGNNEETDDHTGKKKRGFFQKGVKMMGQKDTMYAPDFAIYMERQERLLESGKKKTWREATIIKDRSNLLDGQTFNNPTYKNLSKMFEFLLSRPAGEPHVVEGNPRDVFGDGDDSGAFFRERTILTEEILGEFLRLYPGQTAVEKKCRAELMQRFFGTRSWTKISEATPLGQLRMGLDGLRVYAEQETAVAAAAKEHTGFAESLEALNGKPAAEPGELAVPAIV